MKRYILMLVVLSFTRSAFAAESTARINVWSVDPLVKVFQDASPGASPSRQAEAHVARGEVATFQLVVRSEGALQNLRVACSHFVTQSDKPAPLRARPPRFVGSVPVDRPIQTPPQDQLRKPPAAFPDPLLEETSIDVKAGQAQPIWITVPVPQRTEPGVYRSTVTISAVKSDEKLVVPATLSLRVYRAAVGRSRLWVTNWFSIKWRHMQIAPKNDSPAYWELLRRYARNMAEHRQNVALISPLNLATFTAADGGKLNVDFSRFDRWVKIFTEEGVIGRIEGGHLGGRSGGWNSPFVARIRTVKDGLVTAVSVAPDSPEADRFHAQFLPALVKHLKKRGWFDHYLQHLADEPTKVNAASYRALAALVRKYGKGLRIIEACHTRDLVGSIDVWVPQLNYLHRDFEHYRKRQAAGDEIWFYTCVFPQGEYANRFIEQPLLKTRLLHWINYRYGITGYLHWGYNHWTEDSPFTHTTRPHGGPPYLPAGDPWIVYPGRNGPLDSIRHEAMRDGIADYELLCLLAERDAPAAQRLADRLVLAFDRYNTEIARFRQARRELLELLSR